jgi:hypothetical protein
VAERLAGWGFMALTLGRVEQAVQLWGTADALRESTKTPRAHADGDEFKAGMDGAHKQLDDTTFKMAWNAGRAMSLSYQQAIDYAQQLVQIAE